jgi:hypothetical protein
LGKEFGYVEEGRAADIVAVTRDPLGNIAETDPVKFEMKDGVVFRKKLKQKCVVFLTEKLWNYPLQYGRRACPAQRAGPPVSLLLAISNDGSRR